jgi:hypothetical protein
LGRCRFGGLSRDRWQAGPAGPQVVRGHQDHYGTRLPQLDPPAAITVEPPRSFHLLRCRRPRIPIWCRHHHPTTVWETLAPTQSQFDRNAASCRSASAAPRWPQRDHVGGPSRPVVQP